MVRINRSDSEKEIRVKTSDGKAVYSFGDMWYEYLEDEKVYYPRGFYTELITNTEKQPYWDLLNQSGYTILAGFNGNRQVLKCKMDSVFDGWNDVHMEGGTYFGNGFFTVSKNPLNRNQINRYYNDDSIDDLNVVFYQDISKWLDTDSESTEIDFNKLCMDMGVDHFKIIAVVNYVDFYIPEETESKVEAQMYFEDGAEIDYSFNFEENRYDYYIRDKIERYTYTFTDPDYYKRQISSAHIYDTAPHYIAKKPDDYLYYAPTDRGRRRNLPLR